MSVISKLWRACLPPQRTFFLFHLVHLQIFAARALGMLLVSIKVVATYCIDFSVATNESGTLHKNVILLWDFVF
jgi:hypothetical protein